MGLIYVFIIVTPILFLLFLLLGIFGAVFYNNQSLLISTNISQIQRQSMPFITSFQLQGYSLTFSEASEMRIVPVTLFAFPNCSNSFIVRDSISETVSVTFGSEATTVMVTEWYLLSNSSFNVSFDIQLISNNTEMECFVNFVIFDNLQQYNNFISQENWTNSYNEFCIKNTTSLVNMHFDRNSYYYFGLYTMNPAGIGRVSVRLTGFYLHYNVENNVPLGCTIATLQMGTSSSPQSCTIEINQISVFSSDNSVCIVGNIPRMSLGPAQLATINVYSAAEAGVLVDVYFFFPFIILAALVLIIVALVIPVIFWGCAIHECRVSGEFALPLCDDDDD